MIMAGEPGLRKTESASGIRCCLAGLLKLLYRQDIFASGHGRGAQDAEVGFNPRLSMGKAGKNMKKRQTVQQHPWAKQLMLSCCGRSCLVWCKPDGTKDAEQRPSTDLELRALALAPAGPGRGETRGPTPPPRTTMPHHERER